MKAKQELEGGQETVAEVQKAEGICSGRVVGEMKVGGLYITSGIIDDKEETVVEAVKAAGLEVLEVTYQGEWVSVTARKNG